MKSEYDISALILLLLAVLLTWPAAVHPTRWLWKPDSAASDLAVTHWPNAHFTRMMLWRERRFPVWRQTITCGTPFAGDNPCALHRKSNQPGVGRGKWDGLDGFWYIRCTMGGVSHEEATV